jgi:hypothetical protein
MFIPRPRGVVAWGLAGPRSPSRHQGWVGGGEAILNEPIGQWGGDVAFGCLFICNASCKRQPAVLSPAPL